MLGELWEDQHETAPSCPQEMGGRVAWTHELVQKGGEAIGTVKTKLFFSISVAEYFLWCYTVVINSFISVDSWFRDHLAFSKWVINFGTPEEFAEKSRQTDLCSTSTVYTWPLWHPITKKPMDSHACSSQNFTSVLSKSFFYLLPVCLEQWSKLTAVLTDLKDSIRTLWMWSCQRTQLFFHSQGSHQVQMPTVPWVAVR